MIQLIPIEMMRGEAEEVLYRLLCERTDAKNVNISHVTLPSYEDHQYFVRNHPFQAWYLIRVQTKDGSLDSVGSIYLTKPPSASRAGSEIGIAVFKDRWRNGYARAALRGLMEIHGPGPYFANINPKNAASLALFFSEGFGFCQMTLRKGACPDK